MSDGCKAASVATQRQVCMKCGTLPPGITHVIKIHGESSSCCPAVDRVTAAVAGQHTVGVEYYAG